MRGTYSEFFKVSERRISKFIMSEKSLDYKSDHRPPKEGWCDGNYMCRCFHCDAGFVGDKGSLLCADCAYASPAEMFAKKVLDKVKERTGEGCCDENDDELLELACKLGYGNVRRVIYDPVKHGEIADMDRGRECWFWGKEI
jgi:hypothetical protein